MISRLFRWRKNNYEPRKPLSRFYKYPIYNFIRYTKYIRYRTTPTYFIQTNNVLQKEIF